MTQVFEPLVNSVMGIGELRKIILSYSGLSGHVAFLCTSLAQLTSPLNTVSCVDADKEEYVAKLRKRPESGRSFRYDGSLGAEDEYTEEDRDKEFGDQALIRVFNYTKKTQCERLYFNVLFEAAHEGNEAMYRWCWGTATMSLSHAEAALQGGHIYFMGVHTSVAQVSFPRLLYAIKSGKADVLEEVAINLPRAENKTHPQMRKGYSWLLKGPHPNDLMEQLMFALGRYGTTAMLEVINKAPGFDVPLHPGYLITIMKGALQYNNLPMAESMYGQLPVVYRDQLVLSCALDRCNLRIVQFFIKKAGDSFPRGFNQLYAIGMVHSARSVADIMTMTSYLESRDLYFKDWKTLCLDWKVKRNIVLNTDFLDFLHDRGFQFSTDVLDQMITRCIPSIPDRPLSQWNQVVDQHTIDEPLLLRLVDVIRHVVVRYLPNEDLAKFVRHACTQYERSGAPKLTQSAKDVLNARM